MSWLLSNDVITISELLLYFLLGFAVTTLELCFQAFTLPDMIFNWYGKWIQNLSKKSKFWKYITKPLGLCPYCNGTWLAIICYLYYFGFSLNIFLFIGIVWFYLKISIDKLRLF